MDDNLPAGPRRTVIVDGTEYTLLGTAHVSKASADEVTAEVRSGRYDTVAIELCSGRYQALMDPSAMERMDLFQVLRRGQGGMVAASLALGAYQQRLAEQLGVEPGAEMKAAATEAAATGAEVVLIDRDVGVTLRRLYHSVPWWQRFGLLGGLFASLITSERVSAEDVEKLKQGDILESTFREVAQGSKALYQPLIAERDRYMAARLIQACAGRCKQVLVVVGAGHLDGLARHLQEEASDTVLDPDSVVHVLSKTPPPVRWPRILPWVVVAVVLAGFALGFSKSAELGWAMVGDWVVINGGLSALGVLLAAGHPVTVIGAFFAAPITSINPTVGAGFVAAAIELTVRHPRIGDFQALRTAVTRWHGWWTNRVARTLLVFLFATLGSAAGTYIAGFRIFERLVGA